jgi:hypothetical protein
MLSNQNSELQSEISSVAAVAVAARDACASQQQNMQHVMSSTINAFVSEQLPEHISKAVQSEHAVWKSEVEQLLAQQQLQKQDKSFDFAPAPSPKALSSSGLMIDHSDDIAALSAAVAAHSQSFTQQMQALNELKTALVAQVHIYPKSLQFMFHLINVYTVSGCRVKVVAGRARQCSIHRTAEHCAAISDAAVSAATIDAFVSAAHVDRAGDVCPRVSDRCSGRSGLSIVSSRQFLSFLH